MQTPELPDSSQPERKSFQSGFSPRSNTPFPPADRRRFLGTAAGVAGGLFLNLLAPAQRSATASLLAGNVRPDDLEIIDTHQHLWNLKSQKLAWLEGAPEVLRKTYWLSEYATATEGLNVVGAVYMEVDVVPEQHVAEADELLAICRKGDSPTQGAVISGRPNSEGFGDYIHRYAKTNYIKGVRQVLHSGDAPAGLCLQKQFVRSMRLLGDLQLSFDLCMRPGELSDGVKLAKECPQTRFVLDHCGNADPASFLSDSVRKGDPKHDIEVWKTNIRELAELSNVICKISGVIASAPKDVPFAESLAPIVNHCLDSFGPDRVVFGGDWPVCLLGATYREWVTALKTIISQRPVEDQEKLLSLNARKFYKLDKRPGNR